MRQSAATSAVGQECQQGGAEVSGFADAMQLEMYERLYCPGGISSQQDAQGRFVGVARLEQLDLPQMV